MRKVGFVTLGCKVNQVETAAMEGLFQRAGYEIVPFTEKADIYIINTCAVTSLGERKSRQMIHRAKRLNPEAVIAVTGCYAQLSSEEIQEIPGVRVILGTRNRQDIVKLVQKAEHEDGLFSELTDISTARVFEDIPLYDMPGHTRAFLKIQEGCNNFCSYCIIPYTRGSLRSRSLESISREAGHLLEAGFRELVLTGIHLGAYGRDLSDNITLADAVQQVLSVNGVRRLRLGSLESVEFSPALRQLMLSDERFARQLHLPLQSGSDQVLQAMNRHYTAKDFANLLRALQTDVPGLAITTDIIVGFPGETEEMFQDSISFVKSLDFARIHVFPYSSRPGTPAAALPEQVPSIVKKDRTHVMQELADRKALEFRSRQLGGRGIVLFEQAADGISHGLTGNYIKVYTRDKVECGRMYEVSLSASYKDGVMGSVCEK